MTIVGRCDGDVVEYLNLIQRLEDDTIQLGNFGLKRAYDSVLDYPLDVRCHNVLMSYNDYYPYVNYPISMGDYGFLGDVGYIRGAEHPRTTTCNRVFPGNNHFEDYSDLCFPVEEQLNDWDFMRILEGFPARKPKILLSGEIPQVIYEQFTSDRRSSNTRRNMDRLWDIWKPEKWITSNYNLSETRVVDGVEFIFLGKLETYKLKR